MWQISSFVSCQLAARLKSNQQTRLPNANTAETPSVDPQKHDASSLVGRAIAKMAR